MLLKPKIFKLLFLISIFWSLSLQEEIQKTYYIDPTSPEQQETGDFSLPFHTFTSAFNQARQDVSVIDPADSFSLTFYVKESSLISRFEESPTLFLDEDSRPSSTILITTYSDSKSSFPAASSATLVFRDPTSHLGFVISNTKLVIQGFNFQINIEDGITNTELILVEGEKNQLVISNCEFKDINLNLQNKMFPVFNLKHGEYLIKKSVFSNLDLFNPLFRVQESPNGKVKFELNKFSQVSAHVTSLISVNGLGSFSFMDNEVEKTTGKLFDVTSTKNIIITNNFFFDVIGEFPIQLYTAQNVILDKNSVGFEANENGIHKGFISLLNFDILSIKETKLKGYSGSSPALSISLEESYNSKSTSLLNLEDSVFLDNTLVFNDAMKQGGLSLIHIDFNQKLRVLVDNTTFAGNSILDNQYDPVGRIAASTIWIDAEESSLRIKNCIFKDNKASRSLTNLYANSKDLLVTGSSFVKNTQITTSNPILDNEGAFRSMVWNGQELTFKDSEFIENYSDMGGAISIIEAEAPAVPNNVLIDSCLFEKNRAKVGGAIYTDIMNSNILEAIQLKNNEFKENNADQYKDYNPSSLFETGKKFRLYLEHTANNQKKLYNSGEFTIQNVIPKKPVLENLHFYLSDRTKVKGIVSGQYLASVGMLKSAQVDEEVLLLESFAGKETGPSYTISSLTIVAPHGSQNALKFTLQNKNDPTEKYEFEIQVSMAKKVIQTVECDKGEYYDKVSRYCIRCPPGTFSIERNAQCVDCIVGADCSFGGDRIQVLPGYWRDMTVKVNEEVAIYKCDPKHEHLCIGGMFSHCEKGYIGQGCTKCDVEGIVGHERYRPFLRNSCKSCNFTTLADLFIDIAVLAVPVLLLIATTYLLLSAKTNDEDAANKKLSGCLYINVFIGYMQNLYIMNSLGYISLPTSLDYLTNVIANPSFPAFGVLNCHLPKFLPFDETYQQIISVYSLAILIKALTLALLIKSFSYFTLKKLGLALIWLCFIEAPGFLDFMIRFFDCSGFSIEMECDNRTFISLKTYVLMPLMLFIAVTFPLAITYSLIKGSLRSDENEAHKRLRIMLIAKSSEHIEKSNRNWLSFFWVAFGRFGLLSMSLFETQSFWNLAVVGFYFASAFLFNVARKATLLDGWRSKILLIDVLVAIVNFGFGCVSSMFDFKEIKPAFSNAYFIFNVVYMLVVFVGCLFNSNGIKYGKLEETGNNEVRDQEQQDESQSTPDQRSVPSSEEDS